MIREVDESSTLKCGHNLASCFLLLLTRGSCPKFREVDYGNAKRAVALGREMAFQHSGWSNEGRDSVGEHGGRRQKANGSLER